MSNDNKRLVLRPFQYTIEVTLDVCVPVTTEMLDDQKRANEKVTNILKEMWQILPKHKIHDDGSEIYVPKITTKSSIESRG